MNNTDTTRNGANRINPTKNQNLLQAVIFPIILLLLSFLLLSNSAFAQCTLACNNQINVSIANTCNAEITYDMILEDPNNPGICSPTGNASFFEVTVMNENNTSTLPGSPFVTDTEVGQLHFVKVRHIPSNNLCWGSILVEDKLGPSLTCPPDITVQCTEATDQSVTGAPIATDCSAFDLATFDTGQDLGCGDPVEIITRSFIATDEYGNTSFCTQNISIANPDINAVVFPQNLDNIDLPALPCEDVAANGSLTDPDNTGYPTINGFPIEEGANPCGLNIGYDDNIIDICDGTYKILRSWTVLEWCTSTIINDLQIIKVEDNDGPVIACQAIINTGTTSSTDCTASVVLPAATITDACSSVTNVQIFSSFGTVNGNGGVLANIPIGTHTLSYQASDDCGNTSTCETTLSVADDDSPNVVCDEFTVVTLNGTGMAFVNAETFDDGSFDNCCLNDFTVRRMDGGCGESNTFAEQVKFCCEDIGQSITVEMRVDDCYGNANSCMVQVSVGENSTPTIACPADVTLTCIQDFIDLTLTGEPTAADACGFTAPTFTDVTNLNTCNSGTVTRTWIVNDNQGNTNSCTQTITLEDNTPFSVNFPPDYTASACTSPDELDPEDLPAPFNAPTYINDDCEQLAVNVEDQFFEVAPPACFKIVRTWTVIDWCTYNPATPGGPGQFSAQQTIVVMDNEAPTVVCPNDFTVSTDGVNCAATVQFPQPTVTDCSDEIMVSINNDIGAGFGPFNNVDPGNYDATYFISDGCGNVSTCTLTVTVEEGSAPTPYCVGGLILELSPVDTDGDGIDDNGTVEIWASDFDAGSLDNCGGSVTLSLSPDPTDDVAFFDCSNLGANTISLYVTDENGNQDFCQTSLIIESVDNVCGGNEDGPFIIAGGISDENGNMVENVNVSVNDGITQPGITDTEGHYMFENMTAGEDFTVSPNFDDDPLNGVTTQDLVVMRRHILAEELLDSPYKIIGADVNKNGQVTTSDIVELKQLILASVDDFSNNTPWRFVDAAYQFNDPSNPLAENFPEVYNINNLSTDMMTTDFIAVKIGDMNATASTNGFNGGGSEERSGKVLSFYMNDLKLSSGESTTIPVFAASEQAISSGQFTLSFDAEYIAVEGIQFPENTSFKNNDFGWSQQQSGFITSAWYHDEAVDFSASEPVFYLQIRAKQATRLAGHLDINSALTKAVAYDANEEVMNVHLQINEGLIDTYELSLSQNQPNPFARETAISFSLPTGENAVLEIFDLSGRVLFAQSEGFVKGENVLRIAGTLFPAPGVYYYRLRAEGEILTRKMVKL